MPENEGDRKTDGEKLVNHKEWRINKEEVRAAMKRMKSANPVYPDDTPVKAWRCLGETCSRRLC